jgi:signal transduction histidine kinase
VDDLQAKIVELERFAAIISHEFHAPLVTLQGYLAGLETAAKAGDWDRFHADLSRIQRTGQQLRDTVDSLLQLAKLEANAPAPELVSLHQAALEAAELLQGPISQQHVQLSISSDLPTVIGHPVLWRHVFQNLIDNALKACAGVDDARIDIGCEKQDEQWTCYVRDNGVGLDPQAAQRLFDDGTVGLGLRLVQRIIELHGGKVWVESNGAGQGTTIKWTVNVIRHSA